MPRLRVLAAGTAALLVLVAAFYLLEDVLRFGPDPAPPGWTVSRDIGAATHLEEVHRSRSFVTSFEAPQGRALWADHHGAFRDGDTLRIRVEAGSPFLSELWLMGFPREGGERMPACDASLEDRNGTTRAWGGLLIESGANVCVFTLTPNERISDRTYPELRFTVSGLDPEEIVRVETRRT